MNLVTEAFGRAIKPLFNIGVGEIPGVHALYKFVWGHFGPKGVMLTRVNGLKLYVPCHDWAVAPTLIFAHTWEPEETKVFTQHIKKGMTVIDAGAYIGYYSLLASKLVGIKGKVYAFEPSPECIELLYKNIQLNNCKNIFVVEKAVTDKNGYRAFYISPSNLSGSSIFESSPNLQVGVSTTTLDEAIGNEKVDFIKMDIEGGEPKALNGMTNIIKNSPNLKMIIEVFPARLVEIGSSLEEYIGFLQHHFQLHIIGRNGLTSEVGLWDIQRATRKPAIINLFCQRRDICV